MKDDLEFWKGLIWGLALGSILWLGLFWLARYFT